MSHVEQGPLSAYNSLTDRHLAGYFNATRMRRHLRRSGLVNKRGEIVSENTYRLNMAKKEHKKHVKELLAQAIVNKTLDLERRRQHEIGRKLEEIAKLEVVRRVRDNRYYPDEDLLPFLNSPHTCRSCSPKRQRKKRNGHSYPRPKSSSYIVDDEEAAQEEPVKKLHAQSKRKGDEEILPYLSPRLSRPQSSQGDLDSRHRSRSVPSSANRNKSRSKSADHYELDTVIYMDGDGNLYTKDEVENGRGKEDDKEIDPRHLYALNTEALKKYATLMKEAKEGKGQMSPYLTPQIMPTPPKTPRSARFKRVPASPRTMKQINLVSLHPQEQPKQHKGQIHTMCEVTMKYFGPNLSLPRDQRDPRQEIVVEQQHCGGNTLTVFKDRLLPGSTFSFFSRRHRGYPFSLTLYVEGSMDSRVSTCCEYRHAVGNKLGGKLGHFSLVSISGTLPCYKCQAEKRFQNKKTKPSQEPEDDVQEEVILERERPDTRKDGINDEQTDTGHDITNQEIEVPVEDDEPTPYLDSVFINYDKGERYEDDFEDEEEETKKPARHQEGPKPQWVKKLTVHYTNDLSESSQKSLTDEESVSRISKPSAHPPSITDVERNLDTLENGSLDSKHFSSAAVDDDMFSEFSDIGRDKSDSARSNSESCSTERYTESFVSQSESSEKHSSISSQKALPSEESRGVVTPVVKEDHSVSITVSSDHSNKSGKKSLSSHQTQSSDEERGAVTPAVKEDHSFSSTVSSNDTSGSGKKSSKRSLSLSSHKTQSSEEERGAVTPAVKDNNSSTSVTYSLNRISDSKKTSIKKSSSLSSQKKQLSDEERGVVTPATKEDYCSSSANSSKLVKSKEKDSQKITESFAKKQSYSENSRVQKKEKKILQPHGLTLIQQAYNPEDTADEVSDIETDEAQTPRGLCNDERGFEVNKTSDTSERGEDKTTKAYERRASFESPELKSNSRYTESWKTLNNVAVTDFSREDTPIKRKYLPPLKIPVTKNEYVNEKKQRLLLRPRCLSATERKPYTYSKRPVSADQYFLIERNLFRMRQLAEALNQSSDEETQKPKVEKHEDLSAQIDAFIDDMGDSISCDSDEVSAEINRFLSAMVQESSQTMNGNSDIMSSGCHDDKTNNFNSTQHTAGNGKKKSLESTESRSEANEVSKVKESEKVIENVPRDNKNEAPGLLPSENVFEDDFWDVQGETEEADKIQSAKLYVLNKAMESTQLEKVQFAMEKCPISLVEMQKNDSLNDINGSDEQSKSLMNTENADIVNHNSQNSEIDDIQCVVENNEVGVAIRFTDKRQVDMEKNKMECEENLDNITTIEAKTLVTESTSSSPLLIVSAKTDTHCKENVENITATDSDCLKDTIMQTSFDDLCDIQANQLNSVPPVNDFEEMLTGDGLENMLINSEAEQKDVMYPEQNTKTVELKDTLSDDYRQPESSISQTNNELKSNDEEILNYDDSVRGKIFSKDTFLSTSTIVTRDEFIDASIDQQCPTNNKKTIAVDSVVSPDQDVMTRLKNSPSVIQENSYGESTERSQNSDQDFVELKPIGQNCKCETEEILKECLNEKTSESNHCHGEHLEIQYIGENESIIDVDSISCDSEEVSAEINRFLSTMVQEYSQNNDNNKNGLTHDSHGLMENDLNKQGAEVKQNAQFADRNTDQHTVNKLSKGEKTDNSSKKDGVTEGDKQDKEETTSICNDIEDSKQLSPLSNISPQSEKNKILSHKPNDISDCSGKIQPGTPIPDSVLKSTGEKPTSVPIMLEDHDSETEFINVKEKKSVRFQLLDDIIPPTFEMDIESDPCEAEDISHDNTPEILPVKENGCTDYIADGDKPVFECNEEQNLMESGNNGVYVSSQPSLSLDNVNELVSFPDQSKDSSHENQENYNPLPSVTIENPETENLMHTSEEKLCYPSETRRVENSYTDDGSEKSEVELSNRSEHFIQSTPKQPNNAGNSPQQGVQLSSENEVHTQMCHEENMSLPNRVDGDSINVIIENREPVQEEEIIPQVASVLESKNPPCQYENTSMSNSGNEEESISMQKEETKVNNANEMMKANGESILEEEIIPQVASVSGSKHKIEHQKIESNMNSSTISEHRTSFIDETLPVRNEIANPVEKSPLNDAQQHEMFKKPTPVDNECEQVQTKYIDSSITEQHSVLLQSTSTRVANSHQISMSNSNRNPQGLIEDVPSCDDSMTNTHGEIMPLKILEQEEYSNSKAQSEVTEDSTCELEAPKNNPSLGDGVVKETASALNSMVCLDASSSLVEKDPISREVIVSSKCVQDEHETTPTFSDLRSNDKMQSDEVEIVKTIQEQPSIPMPNEQPEVHNTSVIESCDKERTLSQAVNSTQNTQLDSAHTKNINSEILIDVQSGDVIHETFKSEQIYERQDTKVVVPDTDKKCESRMHSIEEDNEKKVDVSDEDDVPVYVIYMDETCETNDKSDNDTSSKKCVDDFEESDVEDMEIKGQTADIPDEDETTKVESYRDDKYDSDLDTGRKIEGMSSDEEDLNGPRNETVQVDVHNSSTPKKVQDSSSKKYSNVDHESDYSSSSSSSSSPSSSRSSSPSISSRESEKRITRSPSPEVVKEQNTQQHRRPPSPLISQQNRRSSSPPNKQESRRSPSPEIESKANGNQYGLKEDDHPESEKSEPINQKKDLEANKGASPENKSIPTFTFDVVEDDKKEQNDDSDDAMGLPNEDKPFVFGVKQSDEDILSRDLKFGEPLSIDYKDSQLPDTPVYERSETHSNKDAVITSEEVTEQKSVGLTPFVFGAKKPDDDVLSRDLKFGEGLEVNYQDSALPETPEYHLQMDNNQRNTGIDLVQDKSDSGSSSSSSDSASDSSSENDSEDSDSKEVKQIEEPKVIDINKKVDSAKPKDGPFSLTKVEDQNNSLGNDSDSSSVSDDSLPDSSRPGEKVLQMKKGKISRSDSSSSDSSSDEDESNKKTEVETPKVIEIDTERTAGLKTETEHDITDGEIRQEDDTLPAEKKISILTEESMAERNIADESQTKEETEKTVRDTEDSSKVTSESDADNMHGGYDPDNVADGELDPSTHLGKFEVKSSQKHPGSILPLLESQKYEIELNGLDMNKDQLNELTQYLSNNDVTLVNLRNSKISNSEIQQIAEALLSSETNLRMLNLNLNKIGPESMDCIVNILKSKHSMEMLWLHGNPLGDEGIEALCTGLAEIHDNVKTRRRSLRRAQRRLSVDLQASHSTDRASVLRELSKEAPPRKGCILESLDLGDTGMTNEGIKRVAELIELNTDLKTLNLNGNTQITLTGWRKIGEALELNTKLETLTLDYTKLGDSGLEFIAKGLRNNVNFKTLDLEHANIGRRGGRALIELLRKNTSVSDLTLGPGNKIPDSVVNEIRQYLTLNNLSAQQED